MEENFVSCEYRVLWIVDIGCFRRDTVEFDDLEVGTISKVFQRWGANIEPTEVEATETMRDSIDRSLDCRCLDVFTIKEDAASAVRPDLDELNLFTSNGNVEQTFLLRVEISVSHAYRTFVFENQSFERARPVANH